MITLDLLLENAFRMDLALAICIVPIKERLVMSQQYLNAEVLSALVIHVMNVVNSTLTYHTES